MRTIILCILAIPCAFGAAERSLSILIPCGIAIFLWYLHDRSIAATYKVAPFQQYGISPELSQKKRIEEFLRLVAEEIEFVSPELHLYAWFESMNRVAFWYGVEAHKDPREHLRLVKPHSCLRQYHLG